MPDDRQQAIARTNRTFNSLIEWFPRLDAARHVPENMPSTEVLLQPVEESASMPGAILTAITDENGWQNDVLSFSG